MELGGCLTEEEVFQRGERSGDYLRVEEGSTGDMEAPTPSKYKGGGFQSTPKTRGMWVWIEGTVLLFEQGALGLEKALGWACT